MLFISVLLVTEGISASNILHIGDEKKQLILHLRKVTEHIVYDFFDLKLLLKPGCSDLYLRFQDFCKKSQEF